MAQTKRFNKTLGRWQCQWTANTVQHLYSLIKHENKGLSHCLPKPNVFRLSRVTHLHSAWQQQLAVHTPTLCWIGLISVIQGLLCYILFLQFHVEKMAFAYLLLTFPGIKKKLLRSHNYAFFSSYAKAWKANLQYLSVYGDGLSLMCLEMGESASLIAYLRVASK